jgi:hypothetical protein
MSPLTIHIYILVHRDAEFRLSTGDQYAMHGQAKLQHIVPYSLNGHMLKQLNLILK